MLLLVFTSFNSSGHVKLVIDEARALVDCKQPAAEQETLIREAEKSRFTLRRLELMGNVATPDEVLHRRIASRMAEGNLFSRRNLITSLKNVSSLKTIYPITMKDVVVRLDSVEKTFNLQICFKERPQSVHRAS
jgi:hypothetical protein